MKDEQKVYIREKSCIYMYIVFHFSIPFIVTTTNRVLSLIKEEEAEEKEEEENKTKRT